MDRRRAAGALLALAACFTTATAAPTSKNTSLDLYDGPSEGCYYNFQHYGEGDRIMTNEPCLNCTCHNRMLMCYLRVCPFTKPIGQNCTVEKRADQCCPIVTCPDVPVDLLTSTSTTSPAEYGGTGVGKEDNYGCSINGKYFPEGAKVPPTPNKPCEHCYCIRNMTTCVMQECTLHVDGCTPIYHKDVCCPVRYFCDHPDDETLQLDDMTTTVRPTPGFLLTTTTAEEPITEIQTKRECTEDGQIYPDGALIMTEKPCVHCYCMKGDIVCVVQECGTPMENEGKNCTSMPPREGQCCPDTYICEGDEITSKTPLEEITTIISQETTTRRESIEGSGYRKEPGESYTEPSIGFETEVSGEKELITTVSSDLLTQKEELIDNLIENKFGVTDHDISSVITTESLAYIVKEQATDEPDKIPYAIPGEITEDENSETSILEHTTVQDKTMTTVSSTFIQKTLSTVTSQKPSAGMEETTSSGEIIIESTTISDVKKEDKILQPSSIEKKYVTESVPQTTIEEKMITVLDQSQTTPSDKYSDETTKPILPKHTTVISDSVTEGKLSEITPKEVQTDATDITERSSEPLLKEKTTIVHYPFTTESSTTNEEKEISSPIHQDETTTQISEVTESVIATKEQTTHKEIVPEEIPERPLFNKNTYINTMTETGVQITTIPSIYEDDITVATTPKGVEEVEKSNESTAVVKENDTTENLIEETVTTPKPLHEHTLAPKIEFEGELSSEQYFEQSINEESDSTFAPSEKITPQEEKQGTTAATVITTLYLGEIMQPAETSTHNPEDNEITEDILPPGRIPGEGDCLYNGVTHRNESSVPNRNKCETSCKCISSIIKCDPIICSPKPEYMENCQLAYDTSESCCPTYICEETKETMPPQSHSQMSGTQSPTSLPSIQCSGVECEIITEKQSSTVLPDFTKIPSSDDCGPEGCIVQVPEQSIVSGEEPKKCVGNKCSECGHGNCQLTPSQETLHHTNSETIPQACQGSEDCQENKTECQGNNCISKTPTLPEISTLCEEPCTDVLQDCSSGKCFTSGDVPPETPMESEICTDEKDCEEKSCKNDSCRRKEDHIEPSIYPSPPKCIDQNCLHEGVTVTVPITEQVISESTSLPESYSTSISDITVELPNVTTDTVSEKTTSIPLITADHRVSDSLNTGTSEEAASTHTPEITGGLEGENEVHHEEITKKEMYYTEKSILATSEINIDEDKTGTERTLNPTMTESYKVFTTTPVESETQHEDTSLKSPQSSFDKTVSGKPQAPLSEIETNQQVQEEQFTKVPKLEKPTESTESKTYDEQTETPDQHLLSTNILSPQQDTSELQTTPTYIEQSTILLEATEELGEPENIPIISEDTELPEKSEGHDGATIPAIIEKKTTTSSFTDSDETLQQSTTQQQELTSISTEEAITQKEMKTDLSTDLITNSLKPVQDETLTETPFSTDTILFETKTPLVVEGEKVSTETFDIITKKTELPTFEEQTARIDPYPTSSRSIITDSTIKPEYTITPEQEIQEKGEYPEMLTTESSLSLKEKSSEEPDKTIEPEILTEATVPHISELTILTDNTSDKGLTDRPMQTGTELSIPGVITAKPNEGTEENQICDSESECEKSQDRETEIPPCHGDFCTDDKNDCYTTECSQSGLPSKTIPTEICDKENGCQKPLQETTCAYESCNTTEISDSDRIGTSIPRTETTTKTTSILEKELVTKITFEQHVTETEAPTTTILSFGFEKTTEELLIEESEKEITEHPESLITYPPKTTDFDKYGTSEKTDVTQQEESVTSEKPLGSPDLPSLQDIIPENETVAPEEQFSTEEQVKVTEYPALTEVAGVPELSTKPPESPNITDKGDDITELPKITSPKENEYTVKPDTHTDISQSLTPGQEFEQRQPEITTGHREDNTLTDNESETKGPEIFITPGLNVKVPETTISQQSEDEVSKTTEPEIASNEITDLPQIIAISTHPQKEYSETTPYLVELEEHPHEIIESITTLLPSEEPITQEPADIQDTEKEQVFKISSQKPLQTETSFISTEKPSEDFSFGTIRTNAPTTILEENLEKSTVPSISKEASSEFYMTTSLDMQEPHSKFTTEQKYQENGITTVASKLSESKQTPQNPLETETPHSSIEENVSVTIQDAIFSTAATLEYFSPEEELIKVTTITSPKTDDETEGVATQSPSTVHEYTKPGTSTNIYPSTHSAEIEKHVLSNTPPTDEVPQPEEESNFPPSGSYEPEPESDYGEEDQFGPGTCRYGGKVYVSAQQIPRDDPCDFCFCFRSDIICLQQSCPPPIHGCHEEPIQGFCCPRYECPVSMATTLNVTTTTTTTTTTLPPHFLPHAYKGAAQRRGCQIKGQIYKVGDVVRASSGPCLHCTCGGDGQMKCDPKVCTPEPMLRQMIAAAVSAKRRR